MHSIANMTRNSSSYSAITTINSINSIVKTGYIGSELMPLMERGLFLYFYIFEKSTSYTFHLSHQTSFDIVPFVIIPYTLCFFFFYYFNFFFTQLEERIFNYFQSQIKIRENETPRFFIP